MVRDELVKLLRKKMADGQTQEAAAAAAGMSVRTARTWQAGPLPSETERKRAWRTRADPFASVWDSEVLPLLLADKLGVLQATTVIAELRRRHSEAYGPPQLRTQLQPSRGSDDPRAAMGRRRRRARPAAIGAPGRKSHATPPRQVATAAGGIGGRHPRRA